MVPVGLDPPISSTVGPVAASAIAVAPELAVAALEAVAAWLAVAALTPVLVASSCDVGFPTVSDPPAPLNKKSHAQPASFVQVRFREMQESPQAFPTLHFLQQLFGAVLAASTSSASELLFFTRVLFPTACSNSTSDTYNFFNFR